MEKNIGPILIFSPVLVIAIIIGANGESYEMIPAKEGVDPFVVALTQFGILYIVALFVERALEVIIKVCRPGEEICSENGEEEKTKKEKNRERYKVGIQRLALFLSFTLGLLVSLAGVRLLGPIFEVPGNEAWRFQFAVFQFVDIFITAGFIAGGSSMIHNLMALVDDFLQASRKRAKGE